MKVHAGLEIRNRMYSMYTSKSRVRETRNRDKYEQVLISERTHANMFKMFECFI